MKTNVYIAIILSLFVCSCSNPTSHDDTIDLSDYSNQYKMFFREDNSLYSIKSDGSELDTVLQRDQHCQDFTVNKDYTKIAFASGFPAEIYIMNIDGTDLHQATQAPSEESKLNPMFLPQEDALIYGYQGSLFRVNFDGTNMQKIVPDTFQMASHDSRSVFGDKIVLIENLQFTIYVMNTDGSNLSVLPTTGNFPDNPVFSPNGDKVTYTAKIGENSEIFVINADGSGNKNVSNSSKMDEYACWSPDGAKVLFESLDDDGYNYLYTVNPDGSGLRQITKKMPKVNSKWYWPTWSPDGTRLAFADRVGNGDHRDTIFILDIESGITEKLTDGLGNVLWANSL